MAVLDLTFLSESLGFEQSVTVILPEPENLDISKNEKAFTGKLPVLYLLHGHSDDHTSWLRRSSIERYVTMGDKHLAVVLPGVQNSMYTDMVNGWNYFTYVTEELPRLLPDWLRLSKEPEDTFIAGLSMGGYGALKIGLTYPERFAAIASFSGLANIAFDMPDPARASSKETFAVFGTERQNMAGTKHDTLYLLEQAIKNGVKMPKIYQSCGTDDFLYQNNLSFKAVIENKGLDYTYFEQEGLAHEWAFWDSEVEKLLQWLPLRSL